MRKNLIFLIVLLLFTLKAAAQNPDFKHKKYNAGTIVLLDYKRIDAAFITIEKDSIKYTNISNKSKKMAFADINRLSLIEGNRAGTGAAVGGIISAALVFRSLYIVSTVPNAILKDNAPRTFTLLVLGGITAGTLIGAAIPRRTVYFISPKKIGSVTIKPDIIFSQNAIGLGLQARF
jgi:hypothetical protein